MDSKSFTRVMLVAGAFWFATCSYSMVAYAASRVLTGQVAASGAADNVGSNGLPRTSLCIKAHDGNTDEIYCSASTTTATTSNAVELGAGDGYCWEWNDKVMAASMHQATCIVGSGTQTVSYSETIK